MRRQIDNTILEMALVGFSAKRDELIRRIADIERQLGVRRKGARPTSGAETPTVAVKPKRRLSAAGRKAIRDGIKKRWAAFHAKARTAKPSKGSTKPRRTLSASAKAKLAANLELARAARAKKRAARIGA